VDRETCLSFDRQDPLASVRDEFVLPEGVIYLDGNSLGALPRQTLPRMTQVIAEEWGSGLIRSWNAAHWIEAPARRKRRPPEEQRPAGPQLYVAAMMTWSTPGQPVGNPGGLAPSVSVLLEVVDREVLALRRIRKASVAELLHDWHELVLGEALECLSGLPEVDHAPAPVDRAG